VQSSKRTDAIRYLVLLADGSDRFLKKSNRTCKQEDSETAKQDDSEAASKVEIAHLRNRLAGFNECEALVLARLPQEA
jgi:hypothetical protein